MSNTLIEFWDSGQAGASWDTGLQWDVNVGGPLADISRYTQLITSEHRDKPNYITFISIFLQGQADLQAALAALPSQFDLDTASGVFLDQIGQWVGVTRNVNIGLTGVYFSLDSNTLGLDQGSMQGPGDPSTGLFQLPDDQFRTLIRAGIAANNWDGTIPGAYSISNVLFGRAPASSFIYRSNHFAPYSGYSDWTPTNCVMTSGSALSPDGTIDGWQWQRSSVAAAYLVLMGFPTSANFQWSGSIFAQAGSGNYITLKLQFGNGDAVEACFNLNTGTVFSGPTFDIVNSAPANVSVAIAAQGGGWYRCSITALGTSPNDTSAIFLFSGSSNGISTVAGTDSVANTTILVYGAQVEQAAAVSSYANDIRIHDKDNMHIDYELTGPAPDAVTLSLFTNGLLNLRPSGVLIDNYITP